MKIYIERIERDLIDATDSDLKRNLVYGRTQIHYTAIANGNILVGTCASNKQSFKEIEDEIKLSLSGLEDKPKEGKSKTYMCIRKITSIDRGGKSEFVFNCPIEFFKDQITIVAEYSRFNLGDEIKIKEIKSKG